VHAGSNVSLDASASAAACGASVVQYHWSADAGQNPAPVIRNPDSAMASVTAPASGMYMLSLTVTDDSGRTDTAAVIVTSSHATSTAPAGAGDSACLTPVNFTITSQPSSGGGSGTPPSGGGGGGGGSLDLLSLLCGLGLLFFRGARR
jgi:hypothetical protein